MQNNVAFFQKENKLSRANLVTFMLIENGVT